MSPGNCETNNGMPDGDAIALIDELLEIIVRDEFIYRHKLQVGNILMRDTSVVQHLSPPATVPNLLEE